MERQPERHERETLSGYFFANGQASNKAVPLWICSHASALGECFRMSIHCGKRLFCTRYFACLVDGSSDFFEGLDCLFDIARRAGLNEVNDIPHDIEPGRLGFENFRGKIISKARNHADSVDLS